MSGELLNFIREARHRQALDNPEVMILRPRRKYTAAEQVSGPGNQFVGSSPVVSDIEAPWSPTSQDSPDRTFTGERCPSTASGRSWWSSRAIHRSRRRRERRN
ncbi:unnamed protein product [Amoebophrya sp. A120]|nr:unnamed protein product [Amoebophrya sp. A120]|eukprot:GSA120T00015072001.1